MLIFIDESGIHKATDHSTFVLVYIEIKNYENLSKKMTQAEEKLGNRFFSLVKNRLAG